MENIPLMALQEAGLTYNESKVYFSLLVLGTANAMEITKKSQVHRINVYDILERLQEKGLVSSIMNDKKKLYTATNPERLMELVKEKEFLINEAMPQLKQIFSEKKHNNQVYLLMGVQGIMQAYDMMLKQRQTIYSIGGSGMTRQYLKHRHYAWNKKRLELGIKGKLLYFEFTRKDKERGWDDPTMQIRYIPDKFRTKSMIDICGDLVINLHPIQNSILAIVIENKIIADSYRQFFNFMWEHAKE